MKQQEFRNRLDVQQFPGGKIKFYLLALWVSHYNPENIHNGELQGIARLENGRAVYEAENCKITLKFLPNRVTINQIAAIRALPSGGLRVIVCATRWLVNPSIHVVAGVRTVTT
ncbi:MAG: hypothetical protein AUI36_03705 [Cyanobacteria bacterium 13_1_40CM_2_61_4]|nr:MAG: hypothetical protein AUI36_03705 [Cyanobacteria bacterium 13_1_40CM_2_61_4]